MIRQICLFFKTSLVLVFLPHLVFGQPVTVFAAASLGNVLEDIAAAYEGDLVLSYGGSGQIARQVAQGAPADVIILANTAWMDWLVQQGAIDPGDRLDLLGNSLVLIGRKGAEPLAGITAQTLLERLDRGRMAIANTVAVPAGIYGRQWLENAGFWQDISSHLAESENVRMALALVARGETPLGIVYATDARADPSVVTLYDIPGDMHDKIVYVAARNNLRHSSQAADFIEFLTTPHAVGIFRAHGFLPVADPS